MAGKTKQETAQEQSERFMMAAQDTIDAGELSLTADPAAGQYAKYYNANFLGVAVGPHRSQC